MILLGVYQSKNEAISNLWDKDQGRKVIREVMTKTRFKELLTCLRFDDKLRRNNNIFAPIEEFYTLYRNNLCKGYNPGKSLCVDEQLVPFYGRVSFRVYMKNKPDKYGIKIWTLCDNKTSYCLNQMVYIKKEETNTIPPSAKVVLDLVDTCSISLKGRNITCDNYFTSLLLLKELLKRDITLVGTLNNRRKDVPYEFRSGKKREINSMLYGYKDYGIIGSFSPNAKKVVNILS